MVKSMFAGVSGLRAHQNKMDTIGNNIANVNTWGYKSYSYNFMDSIYTTSINSSGGSTNTGGMGGRNPSQVGYGSQMASISFQYKPGAPSPSDNELDCMIDGTGLFLVGSMLGGVTDIKGSGLYLSRVGMFSPDNNGYIVDSQKNYVYGYALKADTGIPEEPAKKAKYELTETEVTIGVDANQNKTITIAGVTIITTEERVDDMVADWIAKAPKEKDANGDLTAAAEALSKYNIKYLTHTGTEAANDITLNLEIEAKVAGVAGNASQAAMKGLFGSGTFETKQAESDLIPGVPAEFEDTLSPIQIPIDPYSGERYNMQSWSVSELGVISGVDINNRPVTLGQLCLVAVENPNGLIKTSGYYFSLGDNAGEAVAIAPDGGQVGSIRSKFLEMANVDLANEFSNMITTQRGFQANSKIITVTDEMLQELVNMKR